MDMLQNVLGGLGGDQKERMRDFSNRYQDGSPHEGYSDDEANEHYGQIAGRLPSDEYESSAEQAFNRMSPQERREFAAWLKQRGGDQYGDETDDPRELARMTNRVQQEQPNILQQAFGQGGALSNPIAKVAVAGIAAMAAQRLLGGNRF